MDELIKLMVNPNAAFKKASESHGGQQATIGLLAQSMFQVGCLFAQCVVITGKMNNEGSFDLV